MRVLIVDDEPDIRRFMKRALALQGMTVDVASDGPAALRQVDQASYDIVLLDVVMPGTSGLDLLPSLLERVPNLRVIMISALIEPRTKVKCLERGAVDYLAKPFVLAELIARVRIHTARAARGVPVLERRSEERRVADRRVNNRITLGQGSATEEHRFIRAPGATLDLRHRKVHIGGRVVSLSERESLVLACLLRRSGGVCTRQEILGEVWGQAAGRNGNLVDVYVGRLRAKLLAENIVTVRNAGYSFHAA